MSFNLVTSFGASSSSYNNTDSDITWQGVLQGSSSAAPLFILNLDVSLHTYNKLGEGPAFIHPITNTVIHDKGIQYIASQFVNPLGAGIDATTSNEADILETN
jgi:hypothetical protein